MKYSLGIVITLLLIPYTLYAQPQSENNLTDAFWMEIWSDTSYRHTNFSSDEKDNKEEDFVITSLSLGTGFRFILANHLFLDPYLKFNLVGDWGRNLWNDVYWNNYYSWGFGGRLRHEYERNDNNKNPLWVDSFSIDIFMEYLFIENSLDNSKDKLPSNLNSENFRSGFSSWLAINSKTFFNNEVSLWGEMWSEFAYESTNFADEDYKNYYILRLNPAIGLKKDLHKFSIQPYYKCSFVEDFGDKRWNKEPWLNNVEYGPGIRLSFEDLIPIDESSLHLYTEFMNIYYFGRVEKEKYEGTSEEDFRVGINIWLPLGATKGSQRRF
jgi:hypothetical protein